MNSTPNTQHQAPNNPAPGNRHKCVVIGAGLGGLSTGCILARNGYEVTVLEQGRQIGGCLQCFRRGDAVFETGMHYIGSADPGQTLNVILEYLGVNDRITLSRLDPDGYDIMSYKGQHYRFANGKSAFISSLLEQFPHSEGELDRYYELVRKVVSSLPVHSLNRDADMSIAAEYQTKSVNEVIDGIVTNPLLRDVLTGCLPLYAGERDYTPFTTHALITDFYNQSAFRIAGGSSVLADALAAKIKGYGGDVVTCKKVARIECSESRATAVITEDGERYDAGLVISSIHPASTMKLIDSHLIRPSYRRRMESLRNTTSAFTVYLKFRDNTVPYMNSNLYYYRNDSTWGCEKYDGSSWPKYLLYMHFCHEENPRFAKVGEILTYMNFEDVRQWMGTTVGHRGKSYDDFKRHMAETALKALEEEVPNLRDSIESYYTSTPLTYYDYTGVPEGAMYGAAKSIDVLGGGRITCKTRIPNLLYSGQSIVCHGMLGVLAGSLVTCAEILSADTVFKQLEDLKFEG